MAGAALAVLGLALIVLATFGPLVAAGAALVGSGLAAGAFGYVGLVGPPMRMNLPEPTPEVEAILERTRQPDPDLWAGR